MSKKKKQSKSKSESVPQKAANQEVSIQDDPYWEVATTHMDIQRLGRYVTIFERFEYEHPQWIDDLMGGVPTYYCVLGVERGSSKNRIEQAYEQKTDFSSYPAETIEEAFCVLSDPKLQKKYDELLSVFKQITKAMPQEDKVEFIEVHNSHVNSEKDYVRMEQLLDTYKKYYTMYTMGMPDFYEIMQLPQDCSVEEIKKYINSDSKLLKRISSILCDKTLRDDHDFLLYFYRNHTQQKYIAQRHERMKKWDLIERPIFEHIILNIMDKSEDIMASMIRCTDIVNANHDWRNYLSLDLNFFSMLGVEADSFTEDKKENERILREKYRPLEKTAQINLAYSVLKNPSKRDDYLWLFENYAWIDTLHGLIPSDVFGFDDEDDEYYLENDEDEYDFDDSDDEEINDVILDLLAKLVKDMEKNPLKQKRMK